MKTIYFTSEELDEAASLIKLGELVAFPTETVYGLGADATNSEAVKKVYQAKGRPSDNPLIVHLSDEKELVKYVEKLPEQAYSLMEKFWPGPLTLIFKIKKGSLPSVVTGGLDTAAFRIPDNKATLELISKAGIPLVGPSANTSGKPSPTQASHVFHDLQGKIAGIIDDGPTRVGRESTVLDLSTDEPVILRPGKVTEKELEQVIGRLGNHRLEVSGEEQPKAPGMKYKHYSPNASVWLVDHRKITWEDAIKWAHKKEKQVGLLAPKQICKVYSDTVEATFNLTTHDNVEEASQNLFSGLRYLDECEEAIVVILTPVYSEDGVGLAYMNRLNKAAEGLVVN